MGYVSAVPVPQPRAARASGTAAPSGGRRSLAAALLLGALGATVVLLSSGQIWAEGTASVGGGTVPVEADGGTVTGVPTALAVVGLAALVAVFAVRRTGRTLVSGLLALSGAGAALASVLGASDSAALDAEAARVTGASAATVSGLTHTAWPYVTAAGALLILLAGLLALRYGSGWPAMGGRYERQGGTRAARPAGATTRPGGGGPDRPEDLWKALDRGEDPTREG
ncbi:TIGR02234 family membrane protein [Streptomyces sp. NPDC093600]|uniref:TIGR02234 family membrane protein n=1 Tax=Streptomyces sp. NPDC093600 TaxID=3366047 RepID=UPI0037F6DA44